jgi:Pvc16 N-terminal domain
MLDTTLHFLAGEVNRHLQRIPGLGDHGGLRPSPVVDAQGHLAMPVNSLGLTLFQLDEERSLRSQPTERVVLGGRELGLPPELRLNATLLVSAHFDQYDQALRLLSHVLNFFHGRPLFTPADSPDLPEGVDRLSMDLLSYGPEQARQMWACVGARHLPSLVYRMRLMLLQGQDQRVQVPAVPMRADTTFGGR